MYVKIYLIGMLQYISYILLQIDISAVSGHSWERDQHTVHSPVVEFSQLTFNDNSVSIY